MTKVLIKGIINLKTKYIKFRLVEKLCELRTYNDKQLLSLLKVLREFVKSNLKNYPEELLTLLVNESSNNLNQEIRNVALNILILIKDAGEDLPSKVINHLDFECKLQNLLKSTDSHDIKYILRKLIKKDFSFISISNSTLDTIAYLLSKDDNDDYIEYTLRFISKLISENIPVTHQFIDGVTKHCSKYHKNEEYLRIIKDLIHKYDQY